VEARTRGPVTVVRWDVPATAPRPPVGAQARRAGFASPARGAQAAARCPLVSGDNRATAAE